MGFGRARIRGQKMVARVRTVAFQGIEAVPDDLRCLPYAVEFSDRLRARVLGRP